VSGGYSPSILDAMRFATTVSNILSLTKPKSYKSLTTKEVFFMATLGGAQGMYSYTVFILINNLWWYKMRDIKDTSC